MVIIHWLLGLMVISNDGNQYCSVFGITVSQDYSHWVIRNQSQNISLLSQERITRASLKRGSWEQSRSVWFMYSTVWLLTTSRLWTQMLSHVCFDSLKNIRLKSRSGSHFISEDEMQPVSKATSSFYKVAFFHKNVLIPAALFTVYLLFLIVTEAACERAEIIYRAKPTCTWPLPWFSLA